MPVLLALYWPSATLDVRYWYCLGHFKRNDH